MPTVAPVRCVWEVERMEALFRQLTQNQRPKVSPPDILDVEERLINQLPGRVDLRIAYRRDGKGLRHPNTEWWLYFYQEMKTDDSVRRVIALLQSLNLDPANHLRISPEGHTTIWVRPTREEDWKL